MSKDSDRITFFLNDREIVANKGSNVLEVALANDIYIPHLCYHPALSVAGNCRLCMVQVGDNPNPTIACKLSPTQGMKVYTNTQPVLVARAAAMEFQLINHPLDCPICDQAGECLLQDYAYDCGRGRSRFEFPKEKDRKRYPIGPRIVYDGERCIKCSRCIRFCTEVSKSEQLTFIARGDRNSVATAPGQPFDDPYSLNTVDLCPVGALTSKDFRFKDRVWFLRSFESICPMCSRGCNIWLQSRRFVVRRILPRYNEMVNGYWMCDKGRESYKEAYSPKRILTPWRKLKSAFESVGWEQAVPQCREMLLQAGRERKAKQLILASEWLSNQEASLLMETFKDIFPQAIFGFKSLVAGQDDELLIRADKGPNAYGLKQLGYKLFETDGEILDLIEKQGVDFVLSFRDNWLGEAASGNVAKVLQQSIFVGTSSHSTNSYFGIILPSAVYTEKEGDWTNFQGITQHFTPGAEKPESVKTESEIINLLAMIAKGVTA